MWALQAEAGADIVMLDNYTPEGLIADAKVLKARFPHVLVEASGGITAATLPAYLDAAIDVVSMGSLTHGYAVADFSLKVQKGAGVAAVSGIVAAGAGK